MTAPNIVLRYVVALNNISVTLLYRGCYDEAIETMKCVCAITKKFVSEPCDNISFSNDEMVNILNQYSLGIQRLANSKANFNESNDTINVHIVYLSNNCINMDDINKKDTIYPILMEYIDFDNINIASLVSIQLYNFALMYSLNTKRLILRKTTTSTASDCITNHHVIAKNLMLLSYSICHHQSEGTMEVEVDTTTNIYVSILRLTSLIMILEENQHTEDECACYRSELCILTTRLHNMDKSTKEVLFPRVTLASAA